MENVEAAAREMDRCAAASAAALEKQAEARNMLEIAKTRLVNADSAVETARVREVDAKEKHEAEEYRLNLANMGKKQAEHQKEEAIQMARAAKEAAQAKGVAASETLDAATAERDRLVTEQQELVEAKETAEEEAQKLRVQLVEARARLVTVGETNHTQADAAAVVALPQPQRRQVVQPTRYVPPAAVAQARGGGRRGGRRRLELGLGRRLGRVPPSQEAPHRVRQEAPGRPLS